MKSPLDYREVTVAKLQHDCHQRLWEAWHIVCCHAEQAGQTVVHRTSSAGTVKDGDISVNKFCAFCGRLGDC